MMRAAKLFECIERSRFARGGGEGDAFHFE